MRSESRGPGKPIAAGRLIMPLTILAAAFAVFTAGSMSPAPESPALFAVLYGRSNQLDWLFYILKTSDRVVLIDCGFEDAGKAREWGVDLASPLRAAKLAGIAPGDVTDVIITHAHFDHAGTVLDWPAARIWISDEAFSAFKSRPFSKEIAERLSVDPRVRTFPDSAEPLPGLVIERVGIHAPGSCILTIDLAGKRAIIVGDEFYSRAEWLSPKPDAPPAQKTLARRLREGESKGTLILTMHESPTPTLRSSPPPSFARVFP